MDLTVRNIIQKLLKSENFEENNLNLIPYATILVNQNRVILAANNAALKVEAKVGTYCWESFGQCASIPEMDKKYYKVHKSAPPSGTKCTFCLGSEALSSQTEQKKVLKVGDSSIETYWIPVDRTRYLHFGIDVTKG